MSEMSDSDYQRLYAEVEKELVTPSMRRKLDMLLNHACDPMAADNQALRSQLTALQAERDAAVRECEELRLAADMLREIPLAALTADKVYREDWPELFTDDDRASMYLDRAVELVLVRITALAKERSAAAAVREGSK